MHPETLASTTFDIAVIGAGVVGCALARRFTLEGARVITLEKNADIIGGASKGNSGILHTGFDAPIGSLEHACVRAGYREYLQIRERLNLPLLATGALVVAWSAADEAKLEAILQQAKANGIGDLERLGPRQISALEPQLAPARAALRVPGEAVIDPWSAPTAYLLQALENGAVVLRNATLTGGRFDGQWRLQTSRGAVTATTVINCAGLYGDRIDALLLGESAFVIRPRKGQFLVFDKPASRLLRSIILPVPNEQTKGVVVCRTIYGNVLVGPTAEDQPSRRDAAVDSATLKRLYATGVAMLPRLADCAVTATYAGIRPATESKDYRLYFRPAKNAITVGGIRSTGLSAALGLARHVYDRYRRWRQIPARAPIPERDRVWPQLGSLAEHAERDWARPDNGGIVCHCELVTEREIRQALTGPLAAASLAGLKRRTRVTMGRCQGFYCAARLSELTAGRLADPIDSPINPPG